MITKTRQQMAVLPKGPPQNALNEIAKLIKDFDADMRRQIDGVSSKGGIIQQIRVSSECFRRTIRGTAPKFWPYDRALSVDETIVTPDFLKYEEEDEYKEEQEEDEEDGEDGEEHEEEDATMTVVNGVVYINEVYQRMQEYVETSTTQL